MEKNPNENIKDETVETEVEETVEEKIEENVESEETPLESEVNEDLEFEETDEDDMLKKFSLLKKEKEKDADEIKLLNNKLKAVQEKHMRITAEYDNFRKRTVKEKEQLYTDACSDVLKEMFPAIDNLERALAMDTEDGALRTGMEMTLKQFNSSLEKLGVTEIDTTGQFDPNFHEAVMHVVDENYGANAIVEVFQKGYIRGEKVLRYSMVKVAN